MVEIIITHSVSTSDRNVLVDGIGSYESGRDIKLDGRRVASIPIKDAEIIAAVMMSHGRQI